MKDLRKWFSGLKSIWFSFYILLMWLFQIKSLMLWVMERYLILEKMIYCSWAFIWLIRLSLLFFTSWLSLQGSRKYKDRLLEKHLQACLFSGTRLQINSLRKFILFNLIVFLWINIWLLQMPFKSICSYTEQIDMTLTVSPWQKRCKQEKFVLHLLLACGYLV